VAGDAVEADARALVSAHAEGPPEAFRSALAKFKNSLQKYVNLMGDKARRGQKIVTSQAEIDRWDRVSADVHGLMPSPYPELMAELDPFDGAIAFRLRGCRRHMVAANKTQRGKSCHAEK